MNNIHYINDIELELVKGSLSNGYEVDYTHRLRSNYLKVKEIKIINPFQFNIFFYDNTKYPLGALYTEFHYSPFILTNKDYPSGTEFLRIIFTTTNADPTEEEIEERINSIILKSNYTQHDLIENRFNQEIYKINNDIFNLSNLNSNILYDNYEIGTLDSSSGQIKEDNTRVRTTDFITKEDFNSLENNSNNINLAYFAYDSNYNRITSCAWQSNIESLTLSDICTVLNLAEEDIIYIKFIFCYKNGSISQISDITNNIKLVLGNGDTKIKQLLDEYASTTESIYLSRYKNKKIAFYGDSITTLENYIPVGNRIYYSLSAMALQNTWWYKVYTALGAQLVINNSWSGRCVSTIRDNESGNLNSAGCSQANINVLGSNGTPDVIIIKLGTNDINRANTLPLGDWDGHLDDDISNDSVADSLMPSFSHAYARMLYRIFITYPNAEIFCCTINHQKRSEITNYNNIARDNKLLNEWNNKIKEIAGIFGAKIIDHDKCGITYFNAATVYQDGATHPNILGMQLLAYNTIQAIDPNCLKN